MARRRWCVSPSLHPWFISSVALTYGLKNMGALPSLSAFSRFAVLRVCPFHIYRISLFLRRIELSPDASTFISKSAETFVISRRQNP